MLRFGLCVFFFLFLPNNVKLLDNGLARTPPMGWMSWGYYMCGDKCKENPEKCLDEKLILSVVDTFYNEGYQEAGYEYIIIDDCWSERVRGENRRLVPDKKRFPRGMKFIADYIHSRGLKFGMYTNIAATTCMQYPGSRGYFDIDAKTFAEWGVDYLKVDGCFVGEDFLNKAYIKLGYHLNITGRPMVYSCSWPYYIQYIHHKKPDYAAISQHCNLWRNYHDVVLSWEAVKTIIQHYAKEYGVLSAHHGPGMWNDPDMIIFGTNALTESQSRVHLAVYVMLSAPILLSCDMSKIIFGTNALSESQSRVHLAVYVMLSAPILLSCDMSKVTAYEKKLLLNLDLIAVGQDPLGIMAKPHSLQKGVTLWAKRHLPMKGDVYHSFSFAIVNFDKEQHLIYFFPKVYGIDSPDGYTVLDVFSGVFLRNVTLHDPVEVTVPPEDVIMYTFFPL